MRKWDQSAKSQKTVGSMIIDPSKKAAEKKVSSQSKSAKKGKENQTPNISDIGSCGSGKRNSGVIARQCRNVHIEIVFIFTLKQTRKRGCMYVDATNVLYKSKFYNMVY